MTLNEKFDKATDGWIVADKCEEIADKYAIDFAEWCIESEGKDYNKYKYRDRKELLEIYKKEKGL